MRIDSVEIHKMGVVDHLEIDFTKIAGPVIALTGENGSGKSSACEMMTGGSWYRECATRGPLSGLSQAPDSYIRTRVVNGAAYTILHEVGRNESTVTKDGEATSATGSRQVSKFDAWAKAHLPPPNVVYASTVAVQGALGFIDLGRRERMGVILKALGVDYLEALAEDARGLAREAKTAISVAQGKLGEISKEAADVREAELRLDRQRAYAADAATEVTAARKAHADVLVEVERVRGLAAEHTARLETRERLAGKLAAAKKALDAVTARIANNQAVLARKAEIETAQARAREIDLELHQAEAQYREEDGRARDHKAAVDLHTQATSDASSRGRAARDRAAKARQDLGREAEILKAVEDAALLRNAIEAETAALGALRLEVEALADSRIDSADDRIKHLREALGEIRDTDTVGNPSSGAALLESVRDLADMTLQADDDAIATAAKLPAELKAKRAAFYAAETALTDRRALLAKTEKIAVLLPTLERAKDQLAAAEAEVHKADQDAKVATLAADQAVSEMRRAREACAGWDRKRAEMKAERAGLAERLGLAEKLTAAEGRIAELEPQRAAAALAVQEATEDLERLPAAVPPPPSPDPGPASRAVESAEKESARAAAAVEQAANAVLAARATADRRAVLEMELAAAEEEFADWTRLASDLGKDGLQAAIVDDAGPEITTLANDFLHTCMGPRFTVAIETQRVHSNGRQMIEDVDVRVFDAERGRDALIETYSGGERVLIGEAVSLSLADMACRTWGVEAPLFIRDESGAALDIEMAPAHVQMIRRATERFPGSKCLFVSHNPETWAYADNVLRLEAGRLVEAA